MDNNLKKKNKFIDNLNIQFNKQPFYDIEDKTNNINDILKETYNSKSKSRIELKNNFDPYNYEVNYFNKIRKDTKGNEFVYFTPYDQGPGRGFGNLNVNNDIRNSEPSRSTTSDFKLSKESKILDRFEFIDNRYMNPNNLVFPFPRSGDTTRKVEDSKIRFDSNQNIIDYNFSLPNIKPNQPFNIEPNQPFNIESNQPFNIESNQAFNIKPNEQLIKDQENSNEIQRERQKEYLRKLNLIDSVINKLKIEYGSQLTREIIEKKLDEMGLRKNTPEFDYN